MKLGRKHAHAPHRCAPRKKQERQKSSLVDHERICPVISAVILPSLSIITLTTLSCDPTSRAPHTNQFAMNWLRGDSSNRLSDNTDPNAVEAFTTPDSNELCRRRLAKLEECLLRLSAGG